MDIKKITYNANQGVINPAYMGIVVEPPDDDFQIEKIAPAPKAIQKIHDMVIGGNITDSDIMNFSTESGVSVIDYSKFEFEPISKVYSFFLVECEEDTNVTFTIESIARQRVWLNSRLCTFCCLEYNERRPIYTIRLARGCNIFCIEQHQALAFFKTTIVITTFEYERRKKHASILYNNYHYEKGKITAAFDMESNESYSAICYNKEFFSFTLAPVDAVHLQNETVFDIDIVEPYKNEKILSLKARLYENININVADLKYRQENPLQHLRFIIRYTTTEKVKKEFSFPLNITEPKGYIQPVKERAEKILSCGNLSNDSISYITYQLKNAYTYDEAAHRVFYTWFEFNKKLNMIEAGQYDKWLNSGGIKNLYYFSRLDDAYIEYYICLPDNFKPENKYPLLIWNMYDNSTESVRIQYFIEIKDTIIVNIHGRGMTFASYVGDAASRENIEDIVKRYHIDENRIYAIGQCSGGYSTWSLITKSPSFYAAAYPSSSYFYEPEFQNLRNLKMYSLTSEVTGAYPEFQKRISSYDLSEYKIDILYVPKIYTAVEHLILDKSILSDMMKVERDPYPNQIFYSTYMNRYRKAYWITINSIAYSKIHAEIRAEIKDGTIYINAKNITGFTLETPPQIQSDIVNFEINGFCHKLKYKPEFVFIYKNEDFEVSDGENAPVKKYKGTGLIDVYLDPLKFINCVYEEDYSTVIEKFMKPSYNTSGGGCSVCYPQLSDCEMDQKPDLFFSQNSFVVVNTNSEKSSFVKTIKNNLFIEMNSEGYSYLGKTYVGNYIIMQIIENPYNKNMSILYINTNNPKLFSKNVFCRKFVLPTYNNGFHPYLNNEALIFDSEKYYKVQECGMPIEVIQTK